MIVREMVKIRLGSLTNVMVDLDLPWSHSAASHAQVTSADPRQLD
jgi:hypothetical protein